LLLNAGYITGKFTREELELASDFIPLYIETFMRNVKRSKGPRLKPAKVHQLHCFVQQIYDFGAAKTLVVKLENQI